MSPSGVIDSSEQRETAMPDQIQRGDLFGTALNPGVWEHGSGCRGRNIVQVLIQAGIRRGSGPIDNGRRVIVLAHIHPVSVEMVVLQVNGSSTPSTTLGRTVGSGESYIQTRPALHSGMTRLAASFADDIGHRVIVLSNIHPLSVELVVLQVNGSSQPSTTLGRTVGSGE